MSQSLIRQLQALGLFPRKSLGQHYLLDETHLTRIVDAAELTTGDTVLEVGPGPGSLTRLLATRAGRVVAVETDPRLVDFLRHELAAHPHVTIIHGDILNFDPCTLNLHNPSRFTPDAPAYKLVANLPYYITSAILRHMLESVCPPDLSVLTVQREVAQRVVAGPPDMSLLAVSVQLYTRPEIVARISAGAFYPPPKVDSAVLRLRRRDRLAVALAAADIPNFFSVVRAGFSQKRKQLRNSLAAGLAQPVAQVVRALETAGIDPRRRAETLTLEEWGRLFGVLVPAA